MSRSNQINSWEKKNKTKELKELAIEYYDWKIHND